MFSVKKAGPRYAVEAAGSLLLIAVCREFSRWLAPSIAEPAIHAAVGFLPVVPIGLFGIAVLRLYRTLDEMLRHQILITIAGGALLSELVHMAYRFVPNANLPRLSPDTPVLIVCVLFVGVFLGLRDSLFEMRKRK